MEKRVFLREATGLVRELDWKDSLSLNLNNIVVGPTIVTILSFGFQLFPASNMALSVLLTFIGGLFLALLWSLLSTAMPRSGAEYVFNSRIVHPVLGFAQNWGFTLNGFVWGGYFAWYFSYLTLAQFSTVVGVTTGNPDFLVWAKILTEPLPVLVLGTLVIVVSVLLHIYGVKTWFRLQNVLIAFGMLGVIICITLFATATPGAFVSNFNAFSLKFTQDPDYYHTIIKMASAGGLQVAAGYDIWQTVACMGVVFYGLGYAAVASAYMGGEIKRVRRNQFLGMLGALCISALLIIMADWTAENVMGREFLTSLAVVQYSPDFKIPVSPVWNLLASVLTNNVLVNVIIQGSFVVWGFVGVGLTMYVISRCFLAWAFDRLVPSILADVSDRFHTPVKGLIIIALGFFATLVAYTLVVELTGDIFAIFTVFNGVLVGVATTFIITPVAGIIFPLRKRLFATSGIRYKIGPVPVISIVGIGSLIFALTVLYCFIAIPGYGATSGIAMPVYLFGSGFLVYYIARVYWRRRGIDISMAFKEIPPE